jgi:hypothetical protein
MAALPVFTTGYNDVKSLPRFVDTKNKARCKFPGNGRENSRIIRDGVGAWKLCRVQKDLES